MMVASSGELAAILGRVADGEQAAFEALYQATSAKLYGIIVRIVVNRSVADDLLQEVYVKAWQRAGDFDAARASPITWLATIARNRAIDEVRRRKPEPQGDIDDLDLAGDDAHPLDARARKEQLGALMACLGQLDGEKRDIVLLAYCQGLSRDALAQRFTRPVPTIKTWLHRSLAQLKACLS
ncbi:sigma-70 family RNA polymerase sigma factor [Lichenihabitans sp. Uapishka_5]|uniref:sigma-70 family RNA polymerase sigma factor n=1 Tax=Lichenihabitans sp. Uapishka_5 TaxID=3037302 RepID=UPI0029E7DF3A|nr:sigma-70 family RNA polymerase sigma factor [Lichenihabitans sp. Uapishka_5]MDX7949843.1 sigma-70 family RNA polymerase sigma factor [Lichenihabitans sp. Uapishka_5]